MYILKWPMAAKIVRPLTHGWMGLEAACKDETSLEMNVSIESSGGNLCIPLAATKF
jgi:hypothetical protein